MKYQNRSFLDDCGNNCGNLGSLSPEAVAGIVATAGGVVTATTQSLFNRPDHEICGKRPILPGRRKEWEECITKHESAAMIRQQMPQPRQSFEPNQKASFLERYKTPLLIGGVALAAFLIFRKK